MKHIIFLFIIVFSLPIQGQDVKRTISINQCIDVITVDGQLNEDTWGVTIMQRKFLK